MKLAAYRAKTWAQIPNWLAKLRLKAQHLSFAASRLRGLPAAWRPTGRLAYFLIAMLFCALAAGSVGIVGNAAQEILRSEAESTALGWAEYLTANVPDLRQIASGHAPSGPSAALLDSLPDMSNIVLLEVLDVEGSSKLLSHGQGTVTFRSDKGPEERQAILRNVRQGAFALNTQSGNGGKEPAYLANVLVPIMQGKTVIGILNIYLDMSQNYQSLYKILTGAALSFGLVLAVAFGLPGLGFWYQTRQKDIAESQLRFLADHDALTELANRATLMAELEKAMVTARDNPLQLAVLCMDLDNFKDVNDALGHETGDGLLKAVALRLRQVLRPGEQVARAGGDEFIILQESIDSKESSAGLARRLIEAFSQPFVIGAHNLKIGPSIGIAIFPDNGSDSETLAKSADLALQAVKTSERGTFRFFEEAMDQLKQRRRHVADQVRVACEANAFTLNFQPVFSLGTGLLAGFEALVRLRGTDGDMVSPAEFVPVAEELGLVTKIGAFVLETACQQAAGWPSDLTVAVNISPNEFRAGDVVERVAAALAKSGLEPERLEIEVTEGLLLADSDNTLRTIEGLKKLGVAIVLDDFGTGYSSLSYLWRFRFDKIKIDQSFVKAIGKNENVSDIIRTIVALGRALDLRVTAEGVETEAQAAVLRAMRCDLVQGYLYGAPVAQPDVPAFVSRPLPRSLAASAQRTAQLAAAST